MNGRVGRAATVEIFNVCTPKAIYTLPAYKVLSARAPGGGLTVYVVPVAGKTKQPVGR